MMAGLGSFNAWSVFRRPLSELYSANVTGVNTTFFVASLVFGLVACSSAILVGGAGPRVVGVTGALLYGLGVFLSSFAEGSLSLLYLTYGLVAAVGLGLAVMAPIAALPSWFPERPGFAYGVAFVGFGMGPLVNVPLMELLLSTTGGPLETFYVLGITYALIIGGTAWFAILSEARVIAGSIGGASAALAASFVAIISASDAVGRLLWPALSDAIGGSGVFLAMFCLQAVAFSLMPTLAVGSFAIFCVLCMAVMSCYGGGYGTISASVGAYFGVRGQGTVYASVCSAPRPRPASARPSSWRAR